MSITDAETIQKVEVSINETVTYNGTNGAPLEVQFASSTKTEVSIASLQGLPTGTPITTGDKRALEDRSANSLVAEPRSPNDICLVSS